MPIASFFSTRPRRAGLAALAVGCLAACTEPSAGDGESPSSAQPVEQLEQAAAPETASAPLSARQTAQWSRNCALCHVRGEGGAPVLGDREAWQERFAQGEAALLEHTVAGLNNMPPLGYCMDCEEEDFLALIRFMGGER